MSLNEACCPSLSLSLSFFSGRVNEVWSAVRGRGRSRKLMGEKSKGRAAMETDVAGRRTETERG